VIGGWALLTLVVCYPNPLVFFLNFYRYWRFPVDASTGARFPAPKAATARQIDRLVLQTVEYQYDWPHYGVPWYVPTPAEVMRDRRGDCESRAVVLASVLAARRIPWRLEASAMHLWVVYPGWRPSAIEDDRLAMMRREGGRVRFQLPTLVQWGELARMQKEALWDVAPLGRRILWVTGVIAWPLLLHVRGRRLAIVRAQRLREGLSV
jgi:hypothetical protein